MNKATDKVIILFSGGKESLYNLHMCVGKFNSIELLHYDYGQLSVDKERECLRHHASIHGIAGHELKLNFPYLNDAIKYGTDAKDSTVPVRNIVFISHAVNIAIERGVNYVCVGVNKFDVNQYTDNSQYFLDDYNKFIERYSHGKVSLLSYSRKFYVEDMHEELIRKNVNIDRLWMCETNGTVLGKRSKNASPEMFYLPPDKHCGECRKCKNFLSMINTESEESKKFVSRFFMDKKPSHFI